MAVGKRGGPAADINMTPMIDVLLVLLIIFMVVQQEMQKGLAVQVPPTDQAASTAQAIDQIVLEVPAPGTFAINSIPVPAERLVAELRGIYTGRNRKVIFVKGAENVAYGDVIFAVDAAKAAGVEITGLVPRTPVQ
jgi:biopolymer transport protein ExbD